MLEVVAGGADRFEKRELAIHLRVSHWAAPGTRKEVGEHVFSVTKFISRFRFARENTFVRFRRPLGVKRRDDLDVVDLNRSGFGGGDVSENEILRWVGSLAQWAVSTKRVSIKFAQWNVPFVEFRFFGWRFDRNGRLTDLEGRFRVVAWLLAVGQPLARVTFALRCRSTGAEANPGSACVRQIVSEVDLLIFLGG